MRLPGSIRRPDQGESTADGVRRLADLIQRSGRTVALTGAGVSVPSGIPDFRTPGEGIWEGVDPFEVASIQAFERDPQRFWDFYRPRFSMLGGKVPNPAHECLAELEGRDLLDAVITQNIDRLHRVAGSRDVIEVHGSIATSSCVACAQTYQLEQVDALFDDRGVPICRGCSGNVKPDVILFGEMLPHAAIERARSLARSADLMICVGSSLEVFPAAGLPELTLASGGEVAIITMGPTPYDRDAVVKLNGDVAAEMPAVLGALA